MQLPDSIYHFEFVNGKCKGTAEQKSVANQVQAAFYFDNDAHGLASKVQGAFYLDKE